MKLILALVMALNLTERVHAAKIAMIKLVLMPMAVLITMRIMIKVRTLELLSLKQTYKLYLSITWGFNWNGPWSHLGPWLLGSKKFGPWEIWVPRSLGPTWKSHVMIFVQGPILLGLIFLRDKGPKKSGAQMRLGTISVIASPEIKNTPFHSFWITFPLFRKYFLTVEILSYLMNLKKNRQSSSFFLLKWEFRSEFYSNWESTNSWNSWLTIEPKEDHTTMWVL